MASLTTEAAASSSLSCLPQSSTDHQNHYKYEVFLSFRGEDTRFGFTDHLHNALCQRGIKTFRDDKLTRGEDISQELLKAIEDSRVSIIIFSQTYAASRWSLDELVKILECRKSRGQKVRAVFYKVDPSDVRNQTGTFGDAFATLDQYKYKDSMDKWRAALKEAADLSGWPFKDGKYETEFINEIVVELCEGVVIPSCEWHVATHPIGLQSQEVISRLLLAEKDIVRMVGIWGPGGIGKTTITKDVFNSIRHGFDGACFLADVRSSSVDRKALAKLQETLLYDILRDSKLKVTSVDQGVSFIETRMRHKKVLLVLDDVSDSSQLERLVPHPHCFRPGSRILITTRDKRWLTAHQVDEVYEVKMLNYVQALNLFSLNAFKSNTPPDDYLGLAKRAVRYAQGLPLALTVLGSHLFLRSREEWEATISTMGSWKGGDQQTKIQEVLRLSYDALDPNLKGYFLDIACFFKGRTASSVGPILEGCYGLKFSIGIARLQEKALIKIDRHGSIWMHDLIEEMGKDLVFQESPDEPGERSRVWNKDAEDILTDNTGTNKVIGLQVYWKSSTISFNAKSFSRMKKLKYISMRCKWMRNESFSGEIDYLSDQLRWLDWQCPLRCFPSDFHAKKLVYLDISDSREITRLWQGRKNFSSLTHMILKDCTSLTELPDFRGIPNLKELDLTGCMSLVEVPHSLGFNDKLATLTVDHCCNLTKFPRKIHWKFLETISIKNCKLEKFPEVGEKMGSLRSMKLKNICIRELDESIGNLIGLRRLYLDDCQNLTTLPSSIYGLQNLEFLELVRCPNLVRFPTNTNSLNEYGCSLSLPKLWYLKIEGCGLSDCDFLMTLDCCETLEMLNLSGKNFVSLPGLTKFVKLWHASVETELEKGIEEIKRSCVLQHHQYESAAGGTFMGGDLLVNKEGIRIVSNREVKVPAPIQAADNQMNLADLYVVSVIGKGNGSVIGKGNGGVVQLVQHKWTGQVFALKVIQMNIQESIRKQIAQELKINLGSQCPYIVVCYQSFYDNGCIACLLEYMDGGSLADLLRKVGSIPEPYISSMCKQILRTLLYLHHENYIIHRDFKPSNLLINHRGEIKITDFGVSTIKTNASERANTFVGTYNYMSPEKLQGSSYSYKSDIWSLGLVLLECATGKFPYTPPDQSEGWDNLFELMTAVVDLPPPCAPSDQFSPEFCSFISACVQKDPKKRLSAHDLLVHPFVSMYDNLNIDLSSYFTEAGSRLATFEPTPNPGLDMNEPTPNPRLDMNEPTLNPGLDMNLEYSIY